MFGRREEDREADKAEQAQIDAAEKAAESVEGTEAPSSFVESGGYCRSRYEVAITGNGPGAPYFDNSDEDITRSEADFHEHCADWDSDD